MQVASITKKILSITILSCILSAHISAQTFKEDSATIQKLAGYMLQKSYCYSDLRVLCKTIGHRLSGTPAAAKAVEWGKAALIEAGCDKVYLQPVMVPHWVRGAEELSVQLKTGKVVKLNPLMLGNSVGTGANGVSANIIEVAHEKELERLGTENIEGKIVFFNYVWDQSKINPFNEYGPCVFYRWAGPSLAAKYGAVGVIIRSAGSAYDNFAHTGSMRYDSAYNKIPACALSYDESNLLQDGIRSQEIKAVKIYSTCHFEAEVQSYNVIGEITGSVFPDEIIDIGGHLDSWDVGEGAHDDGAGVTQTIDVMRTFKRMHIQPRRTVRCVLFMNEENGLRGGTEYARVAKLKKENHICAIETDAGGYSPRGFELSMTEKQKQKVRSWSDVFFALGVYDFTEEGGGADIGPLKRELGTPMMGLYPDPQRYFDLHHTHNDVFEQVHRRELALGGAAIAAMVYMISEYGL
jgi:carboxypeptidase Q